MAKRWNILRILGTVKIRAGWSLALQSLTCSRVGEGKTCKTKCFTHSDTSALACFTWRQCSAWEAKTWLIALWLGPAGFTLPSLPCIALLWLYRFPISACLFVALYLCKALLFCWSRLVWLCMVWCGMLLCGLVWLYLARHGMVCMIAYMHVWYIWYGMVWYDYIWYGMVCMVAYGMVWLVWLPSCRLSHHPWAHPYLNKWRLWCWYKSDDDHLLFHILSNAYTI